MTSHISEADLRVDLRDGKRDAWNWIAQPGTWLTGAQRTDIAQEVRNAASCDLCRRRAGALSPAAVDGRHDQLGQLSDTQADIVHRIVLDQARLTETWLRQTLEAGVAEGEYVEIVAIVALVVILDRFQWAAGLPVDQIPGAAAGAPTRYQPPGAKRNVAWVATVAPEDVVPSDGEVYPVSTGNVVRALSQVPDAKRAYWAFANSCYVPADQIFELATQARAISRPQIELLASRVSVLHNCFY